MTDSADVSKKVEEFFSRHHPRSFSKGQVLLLGGDKVEHVYYLLSGRVKQYDITYRGEEIILNLFKPGTFFPMSLAINGGTTQHIFEADTDIEIYQVPTQEAVDFIRNNADVMFDLLSRVYKGTDGILGRMVYLMSGSARSRLLYELITEAQRFSSKNVDGSYRLDISEKDLGARAGLSRETVSREINKLKKLKIIDIDNKGILIPHLDALQKKLVPLPK